MLNEKNAQFDDNRQDDISTNKSKRKSLGRGLGALLGSDDDFDIELTPSDIIKSGAVYVDIAKLSPSKYQPRKEFDKVALEALSVSIKEKGVLQPLLVRKQGDNYEIIAGERRWRASKLAGLTQVPVIEKDFSDKEVLEVALVENLLRENLSAIEEAEGFQRLMEEFSHTQEALSAIIGKSRSHIANTLRLLTLPEDVQELVKENKISAGHARALVGLENASILAKKILEKDLNVRQVETMVSKQKDNKKEKKTGESKAALLDIKDIERDIAKHFGLKVKISQGASGCGKVVLSYASVAELDKIIDILEQKYK